MASTLSRWRERVRALTRELCVIAAALRDPRTPRRAKVLGVIVIAYALSPIDLIPDPIPVLGYLDDLILVPIGIWLVLRLIPDAVLRDSRAVETELTAGRSSTFAAVSIVALWISAAALVTWSVVR